MLAVASAWIVGAPSRQPNCDGSADHLVSAMHSAFLHHLTIVLDWVGTLVFALSGALVGVQKRFDLFGVLFLSFVVAVVGGMMRDVLIGAVPPVAITDIHYFAIAMIGGVLTFYCYPNVTSHQRQYCCLTRSDLVCLRSSAHRKQ